MKPIDPTTAFSAAIGTQRQTQLGKAQKDEQALKKVAGEFEAIMVQSMLKSMRKTVPEGKLFPKSNAERMYQEMLDAELASQVAKEQSLGLADQITLQLKKYQAESEK